MKIYEVSRTVEDMWDWNVIVFAENEEDALQVAIRNGKKTQDDPDYSIEDYEGYDSFEVDDVYVKELEVKNGVIYQYNTIR